MVYRLTMLFRNAAQNDTISDFKVHVKMAQKKRVVEMTSVLEEYILGTYAHFMFYRIGMG